MQPRQLLVIEDESDIREVAELSMQFTEGWIVRTARRGREGAALTLAIKPDAILLDVMMPIWTAAQALSASFSKTAQGLSLLALLQRRFRLPITINPFKLGVSGIISNPFDPLTMGKQVKTLLSWS